MGRQVATLNSMTGGIYARLARGAAEHFVRSGELLPLPAALPSELYVQRACYVSLFENPGRHLRAMYGELLPRQACLAAEIVTNTAAAIANSRLGRIRRADLSSLAYSVAILGPLQRVGGVEQLDPERFGLQVRSDRGKTATLLPQRTGVETGQDQLATALREAGINLYEESVVLYRFPVNYYE